MDASLVQEFVLESSHGLEKVEQDLLALERTSDPAAINRIFRTLHSIKGSSHFLELKFIEQLSHQAETLLDMLRQKKRPLNAATIDVLLQCVDSLKVMLQRPDFGTTFDISPVLGKLAECISGTLAPSGQATPVPEAAALLPAVAVTPAASAMTPSPTVPSIQLSIQETVLWNPPAVDNQSPVKGIPIGSGEIPLGATVIMEDQNRVAAVARERQHTWPAPAQATMSPAIAPMIPMYAPANSASMPTPMVHVAPATAPSPTVFVNAPTVLSNSASGNGDVLGSSAIRSAATHNPASSSNGPASTTSNHDHGAGSAMDPPHAEARDAEISAEEKLMRVRVKLLDDLLQLTGNMVMARNQLLSKYNFADDPAFVTLSQCVTQVHKTIVQTRMHQIGTLFDRCERLTRDLARQLGKEVVLEVAGRELELDRSVLEAFSDPLTHLLRNAVDHGLESPSERQAAGKSRVGHVKLTAKQQGAEIILAIEDDGRGIDPDVIRQKAIQRKVITAERATTLDRRALLDLIFRSGFSTRDEATSLSGRGVGLDVVRTNLEALGGIVEVQSNVGQGSAFVARLPLTQALVSSSLISALVVTCGDERYAIPQTAVDEIIKVDAHRERDRIRMLNGRMVYQLRDTVLPVVSLRRALELAPTTMEADERERILIVIQFRQQLFGLLVDVILGVDEIVVRPLPRLVKNCGIFSGHTVMGDGRIALILDSGGIVERQQLVFSEQSFANLLHGDHEHQEGAQRLVVFSYADSEYFAIPLEMVSLIEKISLSSIHRVGAQEFIQVMQRTLPLLRLDRVMGVTALPRIEETCVLVPARVSYPIAVLTGRRVAVVDVVQNYEARLSDGKGILGTFMHDGNLVMVLDLYRLYERHSPDRFRLSAVEHRPAQILLAEDSPFFQNLVRSYLEHPPRRLTVANDGQEALELLQAHPEDYDVLVTDIEMPRMDGFELVRKIRSDVNLRTLPVIAVTSLATPEHVERGLREGFDSYLIKIDKEQLVTTLDRYLERGAKHRAAMSSLRKEE